MSDEPMDAEPTNTVSHLADRQPFTATKSFVERPSLNRPDPCADIELPILTKLATDIELARVALPVTLARFPLTRRPDKEQLLPIRLNARTDTELDPTQFPLTESPDWIRPVSRILRFPLAVI